MHKVCGEFLVDLPIDRILAAATNSGQPKGKEVFSHFLIFGEPIEESFFHVETTKESVRIAAGVQVETTKESVRIAAGVAVQIFDFVLTHVVATHVGQVEVKHLSTSLSCIQYTIVCAIRQALFCLPYRIFS